MKITVYSTKTCPYCVKVKQWLTSHGMEFNDLYIDADKVAMQQMVEHSGQMSVPYTIVETDDGAEHGVIGYDEARLKDLLDI